MAPGCVVCAYARRHGAWPPDHRGTHCKRCHRSWTARGQAHCTVCCAHFSSDGTARLHWANRDGRGSRHLDPQEVPGLVQNADGVWHRAGQHPLREAV